MAWKKYLGTVGIGVLWFLSLYYPDEVKQLLNVVVGSVLHTASSDTPYYIVVGGFGLVFILFVIMSIHSLYEWWHRRTNQEAPATKPIVIPQAEPKLEVKIRQRSLGIPQDLTYLLRKDAPSLRVYLYQCLTVKAIEVGVKELMAKAYIDGEGPYYLDWAPKSTEQASKNPKRVNLVPEEEAQLLIWYAAKSVFGPDKDFSFELMLNPDEVFRYDSVRLIKTHLSITIRFIAENYTDEKERHFTLNANSWDDLRLEEAVASEAHMKRQEDRMRHVYAPLHSAVESMRLSENDPQRRFTVGTPINPWTDHPLIMQKVIEVFSLYPDLVENDRVSKGWADNESKLRGRDFWLGGKEVYEWFDAIEEEYHRINSELNPRKSSS